MNEFKFGAGRGSDTEGAGARTPCPTRSGGETLREPSRTGGLRPESLAARVEVARPWFAAREKWVAMLDCASPNSTVGKLCRENIAWIDLSLRRLDGRI